MEGNIRSLEDQICSYVEEKRYFEIQKKKIDSLEKEIEFLIGLIKRPQMTEAENKVRIQDVCFVLRAIQIIRDILEQGWATLFGSRASIRILWTH